MKAYENESYIYPRRPIVIYMSVVTLEDLAMAISNRVKIDVESAMGDANFVMDLFGFEDRIIDNVLEPEDRQLFTYSKKRVCLLQKERRQQSMTAGHGEPTTGS